jgi:hypothetical protein
MIAVFLADISNLSFQTFELSAQLAHRPSQIELHPARRAANPSRADVDRRRNLNGFLSGSEQVHKVLSFDGRRRRILSGNEAASRRVSQTGSEPHQLVLDDKRDKGAAHSSSQKPVLRPVLPRTSCEVSTIGTFMFLLLFLVASIPIVSARRSIKTGA